jgi:hypothetical protein
MNPRQQTSDSEKALRPSVAAQPLRDSTAFSGIFGYLPRHRLRLVGLVLGVGVGQIGQGLEVGGIHVPGEPEGSGTGASPSPVSGAGQLPDVVAFGS